MLGTIADIVAKEVGIEKTIRNELGGKKHVVKIKKERIWILEKITRLTVIG
jgi:hypothetical protein